MRIKVFRQELVVDLVKTNVEIGELCKLGAIFGYDVHVEKAWDSPIGHHQVRYSWPEDAEDWGVVQVAQMAMITAFANGQSGQQLLDDLRHRLEKACFPMDEPMEDTMSIGTDHDGHGHHHDD